MSSEQKEFLGVIKSETQRLTRLINDLLDISRIEAGRMKLSFEAFSLQEFMEDYIREVRALAAQKDISIKVDLKDDLPSIMADGDKIKQIFHNLLSNAIKFSAKGTSIKIRIVEQRGAILVEISDQGIGIPKKDAKRLFEKFYRVDNSMTRTTGGTGLGLAITKHLVEQHGGKIWFESKKGKGTVFSFTLRMGLK